jgi:hypothetical protein
MPEMRAVADIFLYYRDGDERGWDAEMDYLRAEHAVELYALVPSIQRKGVLEPILLGNDGRVWDGHHRLCVALDLGITHVPVIHA